jgi:hypothetical protein
MSYELVFLIIQLLGSSKGSRRGLLGTCIITPHIGAQRLGILSIARAQSKRWIPTVSFHNYYFIKLICFRLNT